LRDIIGRGGRVGLPSLSGFTLLEAGPSVAVLGPSLLEDLANTDDAGLAHFKARWKIYQSYRDQDLLKYRDELRALWARRFAEIDVHAEDDESVPVHITERIEWVEDAWRSERTKPLEQIICEKWVQEPKNRWIVDWTPTVKRIRADPRSLPAVPAWGCIHFATLLKICRNPDCPSRHFIAKRSDQKDCSIACGRPARIKSKRKYWQRRFGAKQKRKPDEAERAREPPADSATCRLETDLRRWWPPPQDLIDFARRCLCPCIACCVARHRPQLTVRLGGHARHHPILLGARIGTPSIKSPSSGSRSVCFPQVGSAEERSPKFPCWRVLASFSPRFRAKCGQERIESQHHCDLGSVQLVRRAKPARHAGCGGAARRSRRVSSGLCENPASRFRS
jgi:hypothetical protein